MGSCFDPPAGSAEGQGGGTLQIKDERGERARLKTWGKKRALCTSLMIKDAPWGALDGREKRPNWLALLSERSAHQQW